MVTPTRRLAVGAAVIGAALGLASPTSAELADGTYALWYCVDPSNQPDTFTGTSCSPGRKHVQLNSYVPLDYYLQGGMSTATAPEGPVVAINNNTLADRANGNGYQLISPESADY